jgi:hypothetical protein
MRKIGARGVAVAAGALMCATVLAPPGRTGGAFADERPKKSSAVQVPVQGGGGVEPVPGAPPPVPPSLESKAVAATVAPGPRLSGTDAASASLRAISMAEGEATLEVEGVREVVRPGSRLGRDTVKSVGPGRLVMERAAAPGEKGGPSLVIVTFDGAGRSKTQVFWTKDPTAPAAPEVKRP